MSTTSPCSLLYLAVDFIARNYQQLCEVREAPDNVVVVRAVLGFKNDYSLPSNICELLLQRFFFHHDSSLQMDFLTLFTDPDRCPLKRFSTGNVYHKFCFAENSYFQFVLKLILKCQNLVELDAGPLFNEDLFQIDLSTSRCAVTLKKLTICGGPNFSTIGLLKNVKLIRGFRNLKHLSLNNCINIEDNDVTTLASEMKNLESLDLSLTRVSRTEVFDKLTTKLKVLIIHGTPLVRDDLTGLLEFSNLCHLDISRKLNDSLHGTNFEISKFFMSEKSLQFLTSLDISESGTLDSEALQSFLHKHGKLCFLGLLGVHYQLKSAVLKKLEVTGEESLPQVLACLNHYRNRPRYLTKALKKLYNLSCADNLKEDVELRRKIIELVLELMRKHTSDDQEDLQTAASACLHNYVRYDNENEPKSLHVSILSDLVDVVIQVLQTFPNAEQIQRNSVIVLYNKYILSAAKFNAYELSQLFFKAIILIPEGNVTGIALDMCAYLSSRISVEETLQLGTRQNIEKLLSIIGAQVATETVGILLLCSLRVLWNLTDEAPQTCNLVINNNGLPLMLQALKAFDAKSDVLTKLLGVMNNLAEVLDVRRVLLCDELVSLLQKYLDTDYSIDVCYFAAGTLCNLILDWPDELVLNCGTKCDIMLSVGNAVNRWKKAVKVMVGYRTFKSFLPLLHSSYPDVQLWAIWAIDHVCSQKVERYGRLCCDEGVVDILRIRSTSDNRWDVKDLAERALGAILKQ